MKTKRSTFVFCFLFYILIHGAAGHATLLGSGESSQGGSWNGQGEVDLDLGFGEIIFGFEGVYLFEDILYTSEIVGTEFFATAGNDPDFSTVAGFLTNGINKTIAWVDESGSGGVGETSTFFSLDGNTVDFIGQDIQAIGLYINHFERRLSGYDLVATINVYDAEPVGNAIVSISSTLSLLVVLAGPVLIWRDGKRRKLIRAQTESEGDDSRFMSAGTQRILKM